MRNRMIGVLAVGLAVLFAGAGAMAASALAAERSSPNGAGETSALSDALLHLKVKASLLDKLGADALGIDVDVEAGHVSLGGEVKQRSSQELAPQVAGAVEGVVAVASSLTLAPSAAGESTPVASAVGKAEREVQDALLETRVKGRLLAEIGKDGLAIEVEAVDGAVSLRGQVSRAKRGMAVEAARTTPGVKKVIDLLAVEGKG